LPHSKQICTPYRPAILLVMAYRHVGFRRDQPDSSRHTVGSVLYLSHPSAWNPIDQESPTLWRRIMKISWRGAGRLLTRPNSSHAARSTCLVRSAGLPSAIEVARRWHQRDYRRFACISPGKRLQNLCDVTPVPVPLGPFGGQDTNRRYPGRISAMASHTKPGPYQIYPSSSEKLVYVRQVLDFQAKEGDRKATDILGPP
jgi:hypothetical protein